MLYDDAELKTFDAAGIVADLRKTFDTGKTYSYTHRQQQLRNLDLFLKEKESAIKQALYDDLRRPSQETSSTE